MTKEIANIAFTGSKPWESNGHEISANASIEQWQQEAGLDYAVKPLDSMFCLNGEYHRVPNRKQLVRTDTMESLGEVSGNKYKVRQPYEILEFFRDLVAANDLRIKVAGQMQGGRKIFALAEVPDSAVEIGRNSGDLVGQHIFLLESFDGTCATQAIAKAMRFFCMNQLTVNTHNGISAKKGGSKVSRRHSQEFDGASMLLELAGMNESFRNFTALANEMVKVRVTENMMQRFLCKLYAESAFDDANNWRRSKFYLDDERVTRQKLNLIADVMNRVDDNAGSNNAAASGTLWGLLNAVTFHHDHEAQTREGKRFESAMVGQGERFKNEAYRLASEVVS